jgi:hypothetical protein
MSLDKYPYRAKFSAFARAVPNIEEQKHIALASLDNLAGVFTDEKLKETIKGNPDLLFWASNLALLDTVNLNDDCLLKSTALKIYKKFELKLLDIEHNREQVVGAIYSAGFSLYSSNKVIGDFEAAVSDDLIQLVVGGYIWRVVCGPLCDFIEVSSYESSPSFGDVSTSFELAFDRYDIGISNGKSRHIKDAKRIISESDREFKKYNSLLRINKGTGLTEDGDLVYRILNGDVLPIGAGVVSKPASGLKGMLAIPEYKLEDEEGENEEASEDEENEDEEGEDEKEGLEIEDEASKVCTANLLDATRSELINLISCANDGLKYQDNIKIDNSSVTHYTTNLIPMKVKSFDELVQNWTEIKKLESVASVITDLKESAEASTRIQIEDAIAAKSVEFAKQLEEQKNLAAEVEKAKLEAEASAKELAASVESLKAELGSIKAAQLAQAAEDKFNARMEVLTTEFDLDDEDLSFLVKEVQAIDSDEAFATYMVKQKKLMAGKKKKAAGSDPFKKEEKCKVDASEVIASVKEVSGQNIPNTSPTEETLAQKVKAIMGETVMIGKSKVSSLKKSQ